MLTPLVTPSPKYSGPIRTLLRHGSVWSLAVAMTLAPSLAQMPDEAAQAQAGFTDGSKARVNRSATLRSLTERISAASCRLVAEIDPDAALNDLGQARFDFDRILDGLVNGNPTLGMPGAESRGRTLAALAETQAVWDPVNAAAVNLVAGVGGPDDAAAVAAGRAALFDQTVDLASIITGQYSDPQALLQSDAAVLNFAVRQRALAYRMSRNMCELATGTGTAETQQELATTAGLFEQTLIALRDGFPGAGINPPPNDTVRNSLNATFDTWTQGKALIAPALGGATPTTDDVIAVASLAEELSRAMNNTITLYLLAAPGQGDVFRVPLEAYGEAELMSWLSYQPMIDAINAQNIAHADLTEDEIIALDQQWRTEASTGGGDLITSLLINPVSGWLTVQQDATAGLVSEVFIMDNKGLNVAQSVETSDYWQGDEAKFQQTYSVGPDAVHISDVELDESTGVYQSQLSLPITDPATGEVIGAVTFGVRVQELL